MKNEINSTNPGSQKRFKLQYLNVETREVTVIARTLEEAYIKATKVVDKRHENGFVSGFRFDNNFVIVWIDFIKDGFKYFKNLPYDKHYHNRDYNGVKFGPEVLDNNSKAA